MHQFDFLCIYIAKQSFHSLSILSDYLCQITLIDPRKHYIIDLLLPPNVYSLAPRTICLFIFFFLFRNFTVLHKLSVKLSQFLFSVSINLFPLQWLQVVVVVCIDTHIPAVENCFVTEIMGKNRKNQWFNAKSQRIIFYIHRLLYAI